MKQAVGTRAAPAARPLCIRKVATGSLAAVALLSGCDKHPADR
ncbi:hypothetical protein ACFOET_02995 [Parapedobacter deserti]|uniref:Uncharacterized protein n=1 Tax=Parapedobacter deserti TaxID=1912957 RepID=A0ABV7JMP1_9SPHI